MKQFVFLEHTADVKFRAYGKNIEEAFANAARATFQIITDIACVKKKKKKIISVQAGTKEQLLYDFLNELLFLVDTEGFLMADVLKVSVKKTKSKFTLRCTIIGDSNKQYEIKSQIKSVTYNDMFIREQKNRVTIQVVHDI